MYLNNFETNKNRNNGYFNNQSEVNYFDNSKKSKTIRERISERIQASTLHVKDIAMK